MKELIGKKSNDNQLTESQMKAIRFRSENQDIPHIAEICIYFGIERKDFVRELKVLLADKEQK